eukprot:480400-Amphidinium_carterae.1
MANAKKNGVFVLALLQQLESQGFFVCLVLAWGMPGCLLQLIYATERVACLFLFANLRTARLDSKGTR